MPEPCQIKSDPKSVMSKSLPSVMTGADNVFLGSSAASVGKTRLSLVKKGKRQSNATQELQSVLSPPQRSESKEVDSLAPYFILMMLINTFI